MSNSRYSKRDIGEIHVHIDEFPSPVGCKSTHVSMGDIKKSSYHISMSDVSEFMTIYQRDVEKERAICIAECPLTPTPFRMDIDLFCTMEKDGVLKKRLYTKKTLSKFIHICQTEIKKIIKPEYTEACRCVVLVKTTSSPIKEEKKIKDGIHMHFPELHLETWSFESLRSRIENECKSQNIFELCDEVVFDIGMATKPWLMYGSSKNIHLEPYLVGHCYNETGQEIGLHDFFHISYENLKVSSQQRRLRQLEHYIPKFLSIRNYPVAKTPLKESFLIKKKEVSVRGKKVRRVRDEEDIMKELKMIRDWDLLGMLSENRTEDHDLWIDVGWTLFNIGEGYEEALDLWIEFSKRSEKFQEGVCEKEWQKMEMGDKTMGSLIFMIQNDDIEKYNEWRSKVTRESLDGFKYDGGGSDGKIAELVFLCYKGAYVCSNVSKNIWYEFKDHRWRKTDGAISLKKKINDEIKNKFVQYKIQLQKRALDEPEEEDAPEGKRKRKIKTNREDIENINRVIGKLETPISLKNIVEMCKLNMYCSRFEKKLDKTRDLIGCENGVIDLRMGIFREGRPDDYISKSTGIYYKEYTGAEEEFLETEKVFRQVYPNRKKLQFMLNVWSMALGGRNTDKLFIVSTGPKDAGKSGIHRLFETALGDYAIKSPAEVIQKGNKNSSSAARPEMMRLGTARAQIFDEISSVSLDIDAMKRQTGNDVQWFRGLYDGEGEDITPMYVTFLQCNVPPKIPGNDDALWGRMKVVQMDSLFSFRAPADEDEQIERNIYPADPNFDRKMQMLSPVVLWKIFKNYKNYKKNGVKIPRCIIEDTLKYRSRNDVYLSFEHENVERVEEEDIENYCISVMELFRIFKDWYRENYPSIRSIPDKISFEREMSKKLGQTIKNKWQGFRIVRQEGEIRRLA